MEPTKPTIMIVDDDKFLLDMYVLKFREHGYEVVGALGSIAALDLLDAPEKPGVILLDIVMPALDGFEFLHKIKTENIAPEARVVILSNLGQETDIEKGKQLGAEGYIVKASATPSEVVTKVEEILSI